MTTLGHLVARDRLATPAVLDAPGDPPRNYDYRRFATTVWKTGNFLRHLGVREGSTVAVADGPVARNPSSEATPESVFAFLGAALLGAKTRFDPPSDPDCRALVAPTETIQEYGLPPGGQRVAYGPRPDDPLVTHFETGMWSENPTFPDVDAVDEDTPALETSGRTYAHATLVGAAEWVCDEYDIDAESVVAVRAPLADAGTVVAGLLAPLSVGATILLPDDERAGDVAVDGADAPEGRVIRPEAVRAELDRWE